MGSYTHIFLILGQDLRDDDMLLDVILDI